MTYCYKDHLKFLKKVTPEDEFFFIAEATKLLYPPKTNLEYQLDLQSDWEPEDILPKEYHDIVCQYLPQEAALTYVSTICDDCGYNLNKNVICTECGLVKTYEVFDTSTIVDTSSLYIIHLYEHFTHFRNLIRGLQGRQKRVIPRHVELILAEDMEYFNDRELTHRNMLIWLKTLNLQKYYRDTHLLMKLLFNEQTHYINIGTHQIECMKFDFMNILKEYARSKPPSRKSFLNYPTIIYYLLRSRYDIFISEEDINLPKTPSKQLFHKNILKTIFVTLGFTWID